MPRDPLLPAPEQAVEVRLLALGRHEASVDDDLLEARAIPGLDDPVASANHSLEEGLHGGRVASDEVAIRASDPIVARWVTRSQVRQDREAVVDQVGEAFLEAG